MDAVDRVRYNDRGKGGIDNPALQPKNLSAINCGERIIRT